MHCHRGRWLTIVLAAACVLSGRPPCDRAFAADPPAPSSPNPAPDRASTAPPINVFLNAPADLDSIWKSLKQPDFVILSGSEYGRLRDSMRGNESPPTPWAAVVEVVTIRGVVRDDLARLEIDLQIHLASEATAWASIRLDHLPLVSVREGNRDVAIRTGDGGSRLAELTGRGRHQLRVQTVVPVRQAAEGRRIDLTIPEAASTRFELDVPHRVSGAQCGVGEPLSAVALKDSGLSRIAADISPRSALGITWRIDDDVVMSLPPLLVAQGEIAIDVEPGTFRTRSSWSIRSNRGIARSLQFSIDARDEVLELELDGQPPPAGMERVEGLTRLTIPLTEPLAPGEERHVVLSTRRPIATGAEARFSFTGFPLTNARDQAGAIGISYGEGLWVSATGSRGVRQIDPRTDLPSDLRARPSTALAYQFTEQPFQLELSVEPSPPQIRSESRHTLFVEPALVRCDTWLDYQPTRGRVYELLIAVPPSFEIESIGPEELVGSWQATPAPTATIGTPEIAGLQLLSVRLLPRLQEGGRFSLHLNGRQPYLTGRDLNVGLPRPVGTIGGGGRVVVVSDPSLTVELNEPADGSGVFRSTTQGAPADWPWPAARPAPSRPILGLRYFQAPSALPLKIASHPRTLLQETKLALRIDPRRIDVTQESEVTVRFGSTDYLDVEIPSALVGRWEIESSGVTTRTEQSTTATGSRIYRIGLSAELEREARLRFHYDLPLPRPLEAGGTLEAEVPWIRLADESRKLAPARLQCEVDPALSAELVGPGWSIDEDRDGNGPNATPVGSRTSTSIRATQASTELPLRLKLTGMNLVSLPRQVVPRLAIQSTQAPEGTLRTWVWLQVESSRSSLGFQLPAEAEVERVRVNGEPVGLVERDGNTGYRIELPTPASGSGRTTVQLEYLQRKPGQATLWEPPNFGSETVVQETIWEVRLPWTRALVGVPPGWADANEWYWDWYVWKRRPRAGLRDLPSWVEGPPATQPTSRDTFSSDYHSYAFGRPGEPRTLSATIWPRAWLVVVASGAALLLGGLVILVWRPTAVLGWASLAVTAVLASSIWHPSVVFLAFQSSFVGLALTALLGGIEHVVERRRIVFPQMEASGQGVGSGASGSTVNHVVGVSADDSTAIRTRPVAISTLDYVPSIGVPSSPIESPGSTATREAGGTGPRPGGARA
ncbi:MAG: hypothetical protein U0794_18230 [Isosphaeraceae bacterium]